MFNIKALVMATAVSAGVVFAMPVTSQAMPQSAPAQIDVAKNGNIVDVRHKKGHKKYSSRYCRYDDDGRCYKRHRYSRYYRHRYHQYDEPYYGYYRPDRYRRGPGVGLYFRID